MSAALQTSTTVASLVFAPVSSSMEFFILFASIISTIRNTFVLLGLHSAQFTLTGSVAFAPYYTFKPCNIFFKP